jgi:hypothetical protein
VLLRTNIRGILHEVGAFGHAREVTADSCGLDTISGNKVIAEFKRLFA